VTLSLTTADLIADLEESPGVAAMAQLDPIDHLWLEWVGKGFLTTADLIADLEESPGVAAMSQLDPIDHLWLEWVGKGFYG